jgi:phage N-6-adenine-methyltransferase
LATISWFAHREIRRRIENREEAEMNRVHFSSKTVEHSTDRKFFRRLNKEFNFTLDPASTRENTTVPSNYYTKEIDGLKQPWKGTIFLNPPYGRDIVKWMKKAVEAFLAGATVVALLPARTDTAWFHDYVLKGGATEIRFVRGRLHFNDSDAGAPFPSMVVIYKPSAKNQHKTRSKRK